MQLWNLLKDFSNGFSEKSIYQIENKKYAAVFGSLRIFM